MKLEKYKNHYSLVKDNINMIFLIPTFLGGIWQLLELSSMSISFIRFFSISQLISDGLLILFVLGVIYLSYKLLSSRFGFNMYRFNTSNHPAPIGIGIGLIILSIIVFYLYYYPYVIDLYRKKSITIADLAMLIPLTMITFGTFIIGVISIIENIIYKNKLFVEKIKKRIVNNKNLREISVGIFMLISTIILLFFLNFFLFDLKTHFYNFRQYLLFPGNSINHELIKEKIIKKHNIKHESQLLYNNDKYLFYRLENDKIIVIDFTELTNVDL